MHSLASVVLLFLLLRASDAQCPDVCACTGLTDTVDCTFRPELGFSFTSIPDDAPSDTRVLIMTGNSISSLPPDNFTAYPQLTTLVLSDNLLTDVPILDIPQLISLELDGNPFESLRDGAFSNLTSLESLYIRRTLLTTLNASTFSGADTLVNLYIDNNPFTELPADLLTFIPQIELLSLTNTPLQSLPDGMFTPLDPSISQVDLALNSWSCDCNLQWLGTYLATDNILFNNDDTLCFWPPAFVNNQLSSVAAVDFQCYSPTISQSPQNETIFSNLTLTISCELDGAPFPEVVWTKDGEVLNLTTRVHLEDIYSASLLFESLELSDSGLYQCFVENPDGSAMSSAGEIIVLEHTCFDTRLTPAHETDVDCGGPFCELCNITEGCLLDRDCVGELVCLYSHQLPSQLNYISSSNPLAFTCANPSLPPQLLENILQSEIPSDIFSSNVSGLQSELDLQDSVRSLIAAQLDVSVATINNVRLSTVEKLIRPLVQVWFDVSRTTRMGEQAHTRVAELVDLGELTATVRISQDGGYYRIRLNL